MLALALLFLACAPRTAAPSALGAADAQREAELREKCAKDANCMPLVAFLAAETPSPARIREAVDLALSAAPGDALSAQVAVLVTDAHPDVSTAEERAAAWLQLCEGHASAAACSAGSRTLAVSEPEVAASLRATGCAGKLPHLCAPATTPTVAVPPAFTAALEAVGGSFEMPPGFHVIPPPENRHFPADLALLSDDGRLEIRYMLADDRPLLAEVAACKERPGCVSADGLRIQQSMPIVGLANLTQSTPDKLLVGKMPPLGVRVEFNANWGITGGGLLAESATPKMTSLVFLHRDPGANLYILYVFHDPTAMEDLQPVAFHALRFEAPVGLGGSWL